MQVMETRQSNAGVLGRFFASHLRTSDLPRSHVEDASNTININVRYSRSAKRAIPHSEEESKEERRRTVPSLRRRRRMVRPSSLHKYGNKRKRATGRRDKTNEWTYLSIVSWLWSIHCTIIRNKCQLLFALLYSNISSWKSLLYQKNSIVRKKTNSLRFRPHLACRRSQRRRVLYTAIKFTTSQIRPAIEDTTPGCSDLHIIA